MRLILDKAGSTLNNENKCRKYDTEKESMKGQPPENKSVISRGLKLLPRNLRSRTSML